MNDVSVRKGQAGPPLSREAFGARYQERFVDPAFDAEREAIARLEAIAFDAYQEGRKAPRTVEAGSVGTEFADPSYRLSLDWLATRDRIARAARRQADPSLPSRVLLCLGSGRDDGSCAGELSKTHRLGGLLREVLEAGRFDVDVLDLATLNSEPLLAIHPCKACASTAMPLCHFPCSCYPNHATGQTNDLMASIYERLTAAHGVIFVTPVYWSQAPSGLKAMIDRLVCADGGNTDPTSTHGKRAAEAKALELAGWAYPKHLGGRVFGVVTHGDASGTEPLAAALTHWLEDMGLVRGGRLAVLERFVGYMEPYATSHDALDRDEALQQEVRNVATSVLEAVLAMRGDRPPQPGSTLREPRPK